jgi:hypothetical protein
MNIALDDGRIYVAYPGSDAVKPMSDFKVGDVVRVDNNPRYYEYAGRERKVEQVSSWVHVRFSDIEAAPYSPLSLTLVSRPSEAKPQMGCMVGSNLDCAAIKFDSVGSHIHWHRQNDSKPPAPAFKVGDRVRVREYPEVVGIVEQVRVHGAYPITIRCSTGKYKGETDCYNALALELLPPEPAGKISPRYDPVHMCDCNPLGEVGHPCVCRSRPMTATAASILYDQEKYLAQQLIERTARKLFRAELESVSDAPLPPNGWMPAGTYMPLRDMPRKHGVGFRWIDTNFPEDLNKGIAKSLPAYERRFSSRTMAWDPMDDTFLEDA